MVDLETIPIGWERGLMASENVKERLRRATSALDEAGVPYAVVGGNAVSEWVSRVDPGAARYTKDVDILYAHADGTILKRLSKNFKRINRVSNGWHHLEHRKTKVRLELIPEGGLTTYGFIPGPHFFGSDDGYLPLWGLIWLKLVSGRIQDDADIAMLAKIRMADVVSARQKLSSELLERFDALIARAKLDLKNEAKIG